MSHLLKLPIASLIIIVLTPYMNIFLFLQEQCAQYWPQSKNSPEKMGSQLSVEILSEGAFEDYICRELKITDLTVSLISMPCSKRPCDGTSIFATFVIC